MSSPRLALLSLIILLTLLSLSGSALAQGGVTPTPAATTPSGTTTTIHVVQKGETLFRIAQQYGTTVEAIAQANGITDVTRIAVGQRLIIPNVAAPAPGAASAGVPTDYIVQPGDSLMDLAWRFGTTVEVIARRNRIVSRTQLYVGLSLSLQEGSNNANGIKNGWIHTVAPDDNLYRIASKYGASIERIVKANGLTRTTVLFPGQRLVIPGPDTSPLLSDVPAPFTEIVMQPARAEQGRTFALHLSTAIPVKVTGSFMGKPFVDFSDDARLNHIIMTGINALAKPGLYPIDLVAVDDQGKQTHFFKQVLVADGGYTSEALTLPPDQADLLDPAVTQPELDQIMALVSKRTPKRYFDGPMGLPCPAAITSQFGTRRSYDGGPYNQFHTGSDFAGAPGSAISAPAGGVVVFTGLLHVRGNATIIDHGWGIYTGYWHQSEIKVHVGDIVQPGQVIGLVGGTGRATGPHLHWEMFVNAVQVDPLQWVRQSFP